MGKEVVYELKDDDLGFLKEKHGPVFQNMDELERAVTGKPVYSVGDVTSYGLMGCKTIDLKAVFYDGKTKRGPIPKYIEERISKWGEREVMVENPKGTITGELLDAAKRVCEAKNRSRVYVEGEEDLAALALFVVLDYGSIVAYGIPEENGTCMVEVTPEIRTAALSLKGWKTKND